MGFDEVLVITDEVDEKLALSSRNLANVHVINVRHANPVCARALEERAAHQGGRRQARGDAQ